MNGIQNAYTPISVLVPQTFEFELEETYLILGKCTRISPPPPSTKNIMLASSA